MQGVWHTTAIQDWQHPSTEWCDRAQEQIPGRNVAIHVGECKDGIPVLGRGGECSKFSSERSTNKSQDGDTVRERIRGQTRSVGVTHFRCKSLRAHSEGATYEAKAESEKDDFGWILSAAQGVPDARLGMDRDQLRRAFPSGRRGEYLQCSRIRKDSDVQ